MNKDWWPTHLTHVPKERPWDDTHVVVAEIRSIDERPHPGQRTTFSALVPMDEVDAVKESLAELSHEVSASGPHPSPRPGFTYDPRFWIGATDLPSQEYEPLILSWSSHDKTVLLPDPRFLMTYGLAPRSAKGGFVFWDDPAGPVYEVVKVSSPSIWTFPLATTATVSISRDYLQDYLTLRNMALVQVFWEIRWNRTDEAIEQRLGDKEAVDVSFADRLVQLNRDLEDRQIVAAQVWGGRLVALPGELPVTENSLEKEGLVWPGFADPVTDENAASMNSSGRVYVDDAVLGAYEGRPKFRVNPKSGSVSFGTQWSVSYCDRVGRNLIRLELKKLYEGVPPHVTRHWNKFAVEPLPDTAYPAVLKERNIAIRAEEVTFAVVTLGESLAALASSIGLSELKPEDFVGLRRSALEYHGWWTFEATDAISRHVPLNLPVDQFLDRCMSLNKLIVEGLAESKLRRTLQVIGVPGNAIADFRTLKLLDCIVRMAQVASATGLELSKEGKQIWDRLENDGTEPSQPVAYLFALYDIRILKAHIAGTRDERLADELTRFGVMPGEEAGGYGKILDNIYDALCVQLFEVAAKIQAAL